MIEHPKCATCAHYKAREQDEETREIPWSTPPKFGKCKLIPMADDMTDWKGYQGDGDVQLYALKAEYAQYLAGVQDGSSYSADLFPHPDFYCPMHSELMPHLVKHG